jgi:hypothetical protein
MIDLYPFLPGKLTQFKDGGLQLRRDPSAPTTRSVLILGTATDGPVLEPVASDGTGAAALFGRSVVNGRPNGATLPQAFEESQLLGCRDIRLMRISGASAAGQLTLPAINATTTVDYNQNVATKTGNLVVTMTTSGVNISEVTLYADGGIIPTSSYTVDSVDGEVTILANKVNVGAVISIRFTAAAVVVTETLDTTTGAAQVITLDYEPNVVGFVLYANNIALAGAAYDLVADELSVDADAAALGAVLTASYTYDSIENRIPVVKAESVFGGTVYNSVKLVVQALDPGPGVKLIIQKPLAKRLSYSETELSFSSVTFATLRELCDAVNAHPLNNVVRLEVSADDEYLASEDLDVHLGVDLAGGLDGTSLTRVQLYEALDTAYKMLENYNVDIIVPAGAMGDWTVPGTHNDMPFAYQLALSCAVISHRGTRTHGVIQTSSPTEPTLASVEAHVVSLEAKSMEFYMRDINGGILTDTDGSTIDLGVYLCVFAGPDQRITAPTRGSYFVNSAASIAGYFSTLPSGTGPMNKTVRAFTSLRYNFGLDQANRLSKKRFVTLKNKNVNFGRSTVVAIEDAPTAAKAGSDYSRFSTVQAVATIVNDVHDIGDPFIGQPASVNNRNAFAAALSKRFEDRIQAQVVQDVVFTLIATPADLALEQMTVELEILANRELRRINLIVGLKPGS